VAISHKLFSYSHFSQYKIIRGILLFVAVLTFVGTFKEKYLALREKGFGKPKCEQMEANIHGFQMDEHICDKLKHAALDIHCKTIEVLIFSNIGFSLFFVQTSAWK